MRPGTEGETPATLVRRAQAGDPGAVACLVERHHEALVRFCRRLVGEGGPDLAQETLLRAVQALGRLQAPDRFPAWLFGIAANLARKWWQGRARWPLSLEELAETFPDVPWQSGEGWGAPDGPGGLPEAAAERAEQTRRLEAAIATLPAPLRRVLVLHYLDGLSYAEIGAALDVPVSTVKGRLFKSRRRLRLALDPDGTTVPRARRSEPAHRRKETAAMATTTQQTADARLVPVTVESIRVTGDPATAENIRPYLEKLFTPLTPEPERPDLSPIVEQLRARFAGARLPVPKTSRIVVLKESDGERYLPIVVGPPEAKSLALHLRGHSGPRPLSHDLMWALVEAGGARLERATITRLDPATSTFYAALTLRRGRGRAVEIDARPSDAINLAVRAGVSLYATEEVLTQAGMTASDGEAPLAPGGRPG